MREIFAAVYSIVFRMTKVKPLAFGFSIAYLSALNMTVLYGLSMLTKDLFPILGSLSIIFKMPYILGTSLAMTAVVWKLTPSQTSMGKETKKRSKYAPLVVYTLVAVLVFAYSMYSDKIFS